MFPSTAVKSRGKLSGVSDCRLWARWPRTLLLFTELKSSTSSRARLFIIIIINVFQSSGASQNFNPDMSQALRSLARCLCCLYYFSCFITVLSANQQRSLGMGERSSFVSQSAARAGQRGLGSSTHVSLWSSVSGVIFMCQDSLILMYFFYCYEHSHQIKQP